MPLLERLQKDMVQAMKAKEELRLSAIRMLKAALMKHKVDTMKDPDEAEEMKVLSSLLKQRKESADMFRKGGREDQALKEEEESKILEEYMPASATDGEIEAAIIAAMGETGSNSIKQMGVVMKAAQARLAGKRIDGKVMSDMVKSKLS